MSRELFWSSKIERVFFWWTWRTTIYKPDGHVVNHGFALSDLGAKKKRDKWLISMGEIP